MFSQPKPGGCSWFLFFPRIDGCVPAAPQPGERSVFCLRTASDPPPRNFIVANAVEVILAAPKKPLDPARGGLGGDAGMLWELPGRCVLHCSAGGAFGQTRAASCGLLATLFISPVL